MKHLLLVFLLSSQFVSAQIKGNENIITSTFDLNKVERIDVNFYAEVVIDMDMKESISITIDENLMDKVKYEIANKTLDLNQKEWIQPSSRAIITIGAPNLNFISQETHDKTVVKNIRAQKFVAQALLGEIELQGNVQILNANVEMGEINALALQSQVTNVNVWSRGIVKLGETTRIEGLVENDGSVVYDGSPIVKVTMKSGGSLSNSENVTEESREISTGTNSESKAKGT